MNNEYNKGSFYNTPNNGFEHTLKNASDMLIIKEPGNPICRFMLEKPVVTIGRENDNNKTDIVLKSGLISRLHAKFVFDSNSNVWYYQEYTDNTNGTFLNDQKLVKNRGTEYSQMIPLEDGDILRVDSRAMVHELGVIIIFTRSISKMDEWQTISLKDISEFRIGRDPANQLVFDQTDVDRVHAIITHDEQGYMIEDKRSINGTFVHDTKMGGTNPVRIRNRDVIKISSRIIILWDDELIYNLPSVRVIPKTQMRISTPSGVGIKVRNLCLAVKPDKEDIKGNGKHEIRDNKKYLLNNVSFDIFPGEFVAILGGSGAGKTTLVNCLTGITQNPPYIGSIMYGTTELRNDYNGLRSRIGIAPQSDTVYDYLSVKKMLIYTAKLRIGDRVEYDKILKRVEIAIEMVDLKEQANSLIKILSGGQRKRASIAAELVCNTNVLFLDEPTSGLDPETEVGIIKRLKDITTDLAMTIIVITHTLQSIHYFDKIIFMAPGGYLSGVGSIDELKSQYGVENIIDAYEKVSKEKHGGIR